MFDSTNQQDAHEFLMYLLNEVSETLEKEEKELIKKVKSLKSTAKKEGEEQGGEFSKLRAGGTVDDEIQRNSDENRMSNGSSQRSEMEGENRLANRESANGTVNGKLPMPQPKTFVQNIFQGTLASETRCLTCESVSERDENFLDVQLDVEQNCSVTHCLSRFSKIERLSGTNKFHCESCGGLQEAEKRMRFKKLPKILVLHLKRFKYLEHPGIHAKLSHRVTFPIELRIPDVHNHENDNLHASSGSASPLSSSLFEEDSDPSYYLTAMVAHLGPTAQSGHYVAFIRSGDKWLTMDDHLVHPINDTDALMNKVFGCWNHNPEEPQNSASAYILFYERRPSSLK